MRVLDPTLNVVARRIVELGAIDEDCRVLDLACGTGAVAREAWARGAQVVGLDVSQAMIKLARQVSSPEITFLAGDAIKLPFDEGVFDVVTCGFGLSHMPKVQAVREVSRVLIPGGWLVGSSWGADGDNRAFAEILSELSRAAGGNVHSFGDILDEETWAHAEQGIAVLSDAGFIAEAVTERLDGRYAGPEAAFEWALAWPAYRETFSEFSEAGRESFRAAALKAAADAPMEWWFAINYFLGQKPIP